MLNLLLVEDNDSTQKMVKLTFESEDVDITIISNGEEAFQKLGESPPNIVIADIDNAGLNGLDLCRKIKDDVNLNNIPVLLLANSEIEFEESLIKESRADAYIAKPFKSVELIDKVVELTDLVVVKPDEPEDAEGRDNMTTTETVAGDTSDDLVADIPETIVKLTVDDEIAEIDSDDSEDVVKSVEILPEEILEDDEKDIDFSDFLNDEVEGVKDSDEVTSQVKDIFPYLEGADYSENMFNEGSNAVDFELDMPDFLQEDRPRFNKVENKTEKHTSNKKEQVPDNSILNKMLGERIQEVIEKLLKDMTKDMLKEAVEKSVKDALEKSFADMSPKIVKVIEDISWEIIPDLAEVLIKKEIKNLKKGIR